MELLSFLLTSMTCMMAKKNMNISIWVDLWRGVIILMVLQFDTFTLAIRTDGSSLPVAPMENGCRMIFSELDLFNTAGNQFLEITRSCLEEPFQTTNEIDMSNYRIIFVNHKGDILGHCKLQGFQKVSNSWFYTVGSSTTPNVNMEIKNCQLSTIKIDGFSQKLPQGISYPMAVFLLRNTKKSVLDKLNLINDGVNFRSTKVDKKIASTIIRNTQDYYLVGTKTPFIFCEYFYQYYFGYEPREGKDFLLRDLGSGSADKSLSRCDNRNENSYSIPMQPETFRYTSISPGSENNCNNAFQLTPHHTKRAKVVSEKCYSYYESAEDRRNFFRNPNRFEMDLRLDELNEETDRIADENVNQIPFEIILQQESPHTWQDCSKFPQDQLKAMQNLEFTPVDVKIIMKPDVCNWFEYILTSQKFRCKFCSQLVSNGIIVDRPGSYLINNIVKKGIGQTKVENKQQGIQARTNNKAYIQSHKEGVIHIMALDYMRLVDSGLSGENLKAEFERKEGPFRKFIESTENLIIACLYSVRMNLSFRSFKVLGEMLLYFGVNTGFLYSTENAMRMISDSISKSLHNDFIAHLLTTTPELSIILDASTDCGGFSNIAVLFQTYGKEKMINVYLYRVIEVKTSETGQEIYNLLMTSLKNDKIDSYVKKHLVALGTDGAKNVKVTFRNLINDFADNEIIGIWCQCHRLEILATRAYKQFDFLVFIDGFINKLCRFLTKKSGKRNNIFRQVIKEFGFKPFELKRIRNMRWVGHRYRAVIPIINRFEVIIETFLSISKDRTFTAAVRDEAEYLINKMKDPAFLAILCFSADAVNELAKFSGLLQTKGESLIGKYALRQQMKDYLISLKRVPGKNVKYLLDNSVATDLEGRAEHGELTLQDFIFHSIDFKQITLNIPDAINSANIQTVTEGYIDAIIQELDAYFPPDVTDLFDIFLPINFPIRHELIIVYGNEEIRSLNSKLKWGFNEDTLLIKWHSLLEAIIQHEQFDNKVAEKPEVFWHYFLNNEAVEWSEEMKTVLNKILTVPPTSSSPETIFSIYSFIKDRKRYNLLPGTVESLIRIRYNGHDDVKLYDTVSIVRDFMSKHSRADDITRPRTSKRTGGSCQINYNEDEDNFDENDFEDDLIAMDMDGDFVDDDYGDDEEEFDYLDNQHSDDDDSEDN